MKNNNILWIILIFLMAILPMACAVESSLGTFKQGSCIQLIQTCSNCTYNNVSSVTAPNGTQSLGLTAMDESGIEYNATFCDTKSIGTYNVNGYGNLDGIKTVWHYSFEITPSGSGEISSGEATIVIILFAVIFLVAILSFIFAHNGKTLVSKSIGYTGVFISIIVLVFYGMVIANSSLRFINISEGFSTFGMIIGIIAGVAVLAFVLFGFWLSYQIWNIKTGRTS